MNILTLIPQGWMTYIGAGIKGLSALLAILTALQGGDLNAIMHSLSLAFGGYAGGSAIASAGLRRAIEAAKQVAAAAAAAQTGS